jgi:hypothetical protein
MDHARPNPEKNCQAAGSMESITDWVHQIGFGFRNICQRHNIEIAMDLDDVHDVAIGKPIKDAVIALVNNAIEAMPNGGELEINLVDGKHQWEIEVADSGAAKSSFPRDRRHDVPEPHTTEQVGRSDLPLIEPVEVSRHLLQLEKLAIELNATRQSWKCPLGGMAEVLIVPKKRYAKSLNGPSTNDVADVITTETSSPTNAFNTNNTNPDQRKAS